MVAGLQCFASMPVGEASRAVNEETLVVVMLESPKGIENCEAIAATPAFTLAGGGDTIAAIQKYDIYDKVSYISTAGGAFLEFLEGKTLPAVDILEQRAKG